MSSTYAVFFCYRLHFFQLIRGWRLPFNQRLENSCTDKQFLTKFRFLSSETASCELKELMATAIFICNLSKLQLQDVASHRAFEKALVKLS